MSGLLAFRQMITGVSAEAEYELMIACLDELPREPVDKWLSDLFAQPLTLTDVQASQAPPVPTAGVTDVSQQYAPNLPTFFQRDLDDAHVAGMEELQRQVTTVVDLMLPRSKAINLHQLLCAANTAEPETLLTGYKFALPDGGVGALAVYARGPEQLPWAEIFIWPGNPELAKQTGPPLDAATLNQPVQLGIGDTTYLVSVVVTDA